MREPRLRSSPSFFHPSTNRRMYRFASNGEMGEPFGMPRRLSRASVVRVFRPRCRPFLRRTVSTLLQRQWSPEQVAGWLKRTYPGEPEKQVSHETIYRSLFIQARGVLKKELLEHLRARRTVRRSRHASMTDVSHRGRGLLL